MILDYRTYVKNGIELLATCPHCTTKSLRTAAMSNSRFVMNLWQFKCKECGLSTLQLIEVIPEGVIILLDEWDV